MEFDKLEKALDVFQEILDIYFEFLDEHDIFIPTKTHAPMTVEEIAR